MNIIYIFTTPSLTTSSVQTKVLSQISGLQNAGAFCKGAFFTSLVNKETKLNENVNFYPIKKTNKKYFNILFQRRELDIVLRDFISKEYDNVDFFYIRYPGATKQFLKIIKKFGSKIILEHQSKELDEIKSLMAENKFGFNPSKFLSWFQYSFMPFYLEYYYGPKISQNIKACVAVTNEIGNYQEKKGCKNKIVITNGIGVFDYQVRVSKNSNVPITLLFLKGTSTIAEWNGIERIIDSIDKYEGSKSDIKLIICGHFMDDEIPQRSFIEHKGYLSKEELNKLFDHVDIGISTLALYKKNFKEATVLKTREYIARGLPFIYAYTDPDLNEDAKEFSIEFPNDNSLIDLNKVIEFAKNTLQNKELPQKMRKYAEEHLDYEVKMKKLLKELQKLKYE